MKKQLDFFITLFFILSIFVSCNRNRLNVDLSDISIEMEIKRFDQDLFNIDTLKIESEVSRLKEQYGEFFDIFTYKVIGIGGTETEGFYDLLKIFVADTLILNVKSLVDKEFYDLNNQEEDLIKAFSYYQFHFPNNKIPKIYTCISGFNQSIVTAENLVGISLDKYLGEDCTYYPMLQIPNYKIEKMYKERIIADVMYSWALTEYPKTEEESHLLSHMIYEGKLMYFVDAMLPDVHDSVKIGYSKKQLDWCYNNEGQMWTNLIEQNRLYITGSMDIKRLIGDAPYTNGFPLESPGRAGVWIGWQIVRKYMGKHPEISLIDLFELDDSQKLLNDSGYYPL